MIKKIGISLAIVLALLCALPLQAQNTSNDQQAQADQMVRLGNKYRNAARHSPVPDYSQALHYYRKAQQMGSPEALNALGNMHLSGLGVQQSYPQAINYFKQAAALGNASAMYNIALVHKFGHGVEVDYTKAYNWYIKCANAGGSSGMYGAGYFLANGLGVQQNYTKALEWFTRGHKAGNPACTFWLGLCHRNGYGVAKDEAKAQQYLKKSALEGYWLAMAELQYNKGEVATTKSDVMAQMRNGYSKANVSSTVNLNGNWSGKIACFDASGTYLVAEVPVEMQMQHTGQHFSGQWQQQGIKPFSIDGTVANGAIYYNNGQWQQNDRYNVTLNWELSNGQFTTYTQNNKLVLAGRLHTYSSYTKEPGRPTYLLIKQDVVTEPDNTTDTLLQARTMVADTLTLQPPATKAIAALPADSSTIEPTTALTPVDNGVADTTRPTQPQTITEHELLVQQLQTDPELKAWPNPFDNQLRVSYQLHANAEVSLQLYAMTGQMVNLLYQGNDDAGNYQKEFAINTKPGQYILVLSINGERSTTLLIKK